MLKNKDLKILIYSFIHQPIYSSTSEHEKHILSLFFMGKIKVKNKNLGLTSSIVHLIFF